MTDLVKVYKTPSIAKGVATKNDMPATAIVEKGGMAAIVLAPKFRAAPINSPTDTSRKAWVWARANELHNAGMTYKQLRHTIFGEAAALGYRYVGAEISRWRHRFN